MRLILPPIVCGNRYRSNQTSEPGGKPGIYGDRKIRVVAQIVALRVRVRIPSVTPRAPMFQGRRYGLQNRMARFDSSGVRQFLTCDAAG